MTQRLVRVAIENWDDLDGYAVGHGMRDPRQLPLDRFCRWVWYMISRNKDEAETRKLKAKLWQPPKGEVTEDKPIDARSPWSAENEMGAFNAFKAQTGKPSLVMPPSAADEGP